MSERLLETFLTEMRGTPPDVPYAPGVNFDELVKGDESPMFVTLKVGAVGAESRNKTASGKARWYPAEVENVVVRTVEESKVTGIRGHLRDDERAYANPPAVWRAVGAKIDESKQTWVKFYVFPTATEVREEIRTAKATNAPIGLSRYATGFVNSETGAVDAESYVLEGFDFVHPARVGILNAAHVPFVTSESEQEADDPEIIENEHLTEATDDITEEEKPMPDGMIAITEAEAARDKAVKEAVNEARTADRKLIGELSQSNTELNNKLTDYTAVMELLGNPQYPHVELQNRLSEIASLERENAQLLEGYIAAETAKKVAIESVRPVVESIVKEAKPATRSAVDTKLSAVLERPEFKELLKNQVKQEMGPNQNPANTEPSDDTTASETAASEFETIW